jgi:CheY-like chemotaxis protein
MGGFDVLNALRSDDRTSSIPIVIVSAHAGADERQRAASLGADGFVQKPVDEELLFSLLDRLLKKVGID